MLKLVLMAGVLTLTSCLKDSFGDEPDSKEENPRNQPGESKDTVDTVSHAMTAAQAMQLACDFLNTRGRTTSPSDIVTVTPCLYTDCHVAGADEKGSEVAFFAHGLKDGGFVITAADDRHTPVFAYIETGTFDLTANETGLFYQSLAYRCANAADNSLYKSRVDQLADKAETTTSYLSSRWGTGHPYNMAVVGNCTSEAVAMGQIACYHEWPSTFEYRISNSQSEQVTIDWDSVKAAMTDTQGQLADDASCAEPVSKFIASVPNGSDAADRSQKAIAYMKKLGFNIADSLCYSPWTDDSGKRIDRDLANRLLVYAVANWKTADPVYKWDNCNNVWVIDGTDPLFFHCNWGKDGQSNGFFLKAAFSRYSSNTFELGTDLIAIGRP